MGCGEERVHSPLPATVEEVWERVGGRVPLTGNVLTAVNLEYVETDHPVADGDEVAFFSARYRRLTTFARFERAQDVRAQARPFAGGRAAVRTGW